MDRRPPHQEPTTQATRSLRDESTTAALATQRSAPEASRLTGPPSSEVESGSGPGRLVLGRYRLEGRLGAGGFGVVWRGRDERLERDVAVKEIPREGPAPGRAEREARAAARLNHPGIVTLYELGSDEHAFFLVSELVHGRSLAELLKAGALSDSDVARVGTAMCEALAHAHARGVIHRDVKPQNVMVVAEPAAGTGFAKLTDFGASTLGAPDGLTGPGDVIGTLAYMAPEQADGFAVTEAVDLYALALTLYEGLAGHNPVLGSGLADTARRVGRPMPALERTRRDLPLALCRALDAALDPEPARRGTVRELHRALEGAEHELSGEGGLGEAETLERFGLRPRRGRRVLALRPHPRASPEGLASGLWERLVGRLVAGSAAGLLLLVGLEGLGLPPPPVEAPVAAAVTALGVALVPRVAWLAAASLFLAWVAFPAVSRDGLALLLAPALAAVPLLAPRAGLAWTLPAVAPALGAVLLGPAYPALAGLASRPLRRAGLGAAGFLWLATVEVLTGRTLLFGPVKGTGTAEELGTSAVAIAAEAFWPFVTSPMAAAALMWALFAMAFPLLVGGRAPVIDLLGALTWSVGLVAAHLALTEQLRPWLADGGPPSPVGGAVLGAVGASAALGVWRRMASG